MPLYNYTCNSCGEFQEWQSIAASDAPLACPACKVPASRVLSSPHVRTSSARIRYVVEARNEKSAHEPAIEHRLKSLPHHHHGHGKSGHDAHAHLPVKRSHRPWMIGH